MSSSGFANPRHPAKLLAVHRYSTESASQKHFTAQFAAALGPPAPPPPPPDEEPTAYQAHIARLEARAAAAARRRLEILADPLFALTRPRARWGDPPDPITGLHNYPYGGTYPCVGICCLGDTNLADIVDAMVLGPHMDDITDFSDEAMCRDEAMTAIIAAVATDAMTSADTTALASAMRSISVSGDDTMLDQAGAAASPNQAAAAAPLNPAGATAPPTLVGAASPPIQVAAAAPLAQVPTVGGNGRSREAYVRTFIATLQRLLPQDPQAVANAWANRQSAVGPQAVSEIQPCTVEATTAPGTFRGMPGLYAMDSARRTAGISRSALLAPLVPVGDTPQQAAVPPAVSRSQAIEALMQKQARQRVQQEEDQQALQALLDTPADECSAPLPMVSRPEVARMPSYAAATGASDGTALLTAMFGRSPALQRDERATNSAEVLHLRAQMQQMGQQQLHQQQQLQYLTTQGVNTRGSLFSHSDTPAAAAAPAIGVTPVRVTRANDNIARITIKTPAGFPANLRTLSVADLKAQAYIICKYIAMGDVPFADAIPFFFPPCHASWIVNLVRSEPDIQPEQMVNELVGWAAGDVRPESAIALEQLIAGKTTQGTESAPLYAQRFLNVLRNLPENSDKNMRYLCQHYIAGLNPELRALCCLTRDDNPWENLSQLMKYSYSAEYRMSQSALVHTQGQSGQPGGHAYPPQKKARYNNNNNFNRQSSRPAYNGGAQPMDTGGARPSGSVAAVTGHGSTRPQPPRIAKTWVAQEPALVAMDIRDCPVRTLPGQRLSDNDKRTLWRWGICTYCREGRHTPKDCPLVALKQEMPHKAPK